MRFAAFLIVAPLAFLLAGCSGVDREDNYEIDPARKARYENGSVLSEKGGVSLWGGREDEAAKAAGSGIGVNALLWRAALDTLSFMPIASADPFGGTIITDWYAPPSSPSERIKLNVFILSRELRADAVKVSVFRQEYTAQGWVDAKTNVATAGTVEDAILTRARQMRVKQLSDTK